MYALATVRAIIATAIVVFASTSCARISGGNGAARPIDELAQIRSWLPGAWHATESESTEVWSAVGEVLAGVGFAVRDGKTVFYDVMLVHADGQRAVLTAIPAGERSVDFGAVEVKRARARFANPQHDDPRALSYRLDGESLRIEIRGDRGRRELVMQAAERERAPEIEGLDRAFAADSARRGGQAWAIRFADDGAMWPRGAERRQGPKAIAEAIDALANRGLRLQWTPSVSGLSPAGDLGFTAGPYRIVRGDGTTAETGCYVTIWRRDTEGWRIVFDTGASNPSP